MSAARQLADSMFSDLTHEAAGAVLLEHQAATQRWLAAAPADRPQLWRAVEAAWRRVKQHGLTSDAQHSSTTLARHHGKLRSQAR